MAAVSARMALSKNRKAICVTLQLDTLWFGFSEIDKRDYFKKPFLFKESNR